MLMLIGIISHTNPARLHVADEGALSISVCQYVIQLIVDHCGLRVKRVTLSLYFSFVVCRDGQRVAATHLLSLSNSAYLPNGSHEEFEDIKEVIRIRKSKKNRQRHGQKKKYKRTNNDLQNIHIKLKIE